MMVRDNVDGTTWVAGYNAQYLLGNGTTTNSSIAVKAQRRERGQTIDLLNVKDLAHISCGTYQSAMVYTDTGWIYGVGYTGTGQLSLGSQPTWQQSVGSDGNGYEHEGSQAFWLPARVPSSMLGKVSGIQSAGTKSNAANNYGNFWIMTNTGRLWVVGDGASSGCASLGQIDYQVGASDANHNQSVFRAVMQE
jgi:alpha-tubulin suppressor-like RCC1 family protein